MKKKLCLLLAILQVLLCFEGCGNNAKGPEPTEDSISYAFPAEVPEYEDTKQLDMIAFWSPPPTLEHYQWMVDCGFTETVIDGKYGNKHNTDQLMETLSICDQVGIEAYISSNRGERLSIKKDYSQYASFQGFYTDEPFSKYDFDTIAANTKTLNDTYPDKGYLYLTTLISDVPTDYNSDFLTFEEYTDYYFINSASGQTRFQFDHYPLIGNSVKGEISAKWLSITETHAANAKKYGMDMYPYIATMSFFSAGRRKPAEDDLRYQSYVNLAYGAKGLAYFCYMTPGVPPYDGEFRLSDYALVNYEDPDDISTYYRTEAWYFTQTVNNELKAFDHVLLSFNWQGVMKSAGSEAATSAGKNNFGNAKNWLKRHDGIKKISTTEDAIIGVFQDENGYEGFLLVNFSDPLYDCTNDATIQFRGATRAVVYVKGQPQIVDLTDGVYSATLEPGEGQFIIPLA